MSHPPSGNVPDGHSHELSYLHPDRLRIGGVGVFAGDWAWVDGPNGPRIPVGFVGTFIDTQNGSAVFACTRDVAEAIVAEQHRLRGQERNRLADLGLTGEELDTQVDDIPPMHFDGDELVVDERRNHGEDDGETRIGPGDDGRYVLDGWSWTAVDPTACDRIAGTIPVYGQHQEFVMLTHSPMRAPHDRLTVTAVRYLETHGGVAYTADVTLDGLPAGTIENAGHGGATMFRPRGNRFGWRDLEQFVAGCRWQGMPADEEQVVQALVNEHEIGDATAAADALGRRLIRLLDDHANIAATFTTERIPASVAARHAWAARLTATEGPHHPYLAVFRWQFWTGRHWTDLALPISTAHTNWQDAAE
ncbi:hypothetical protein ACQEVZ_55430 [Dactylosporangium sp. CA-152071]|uniref:hypothetical protein n=1 Tax=Dactylosporangium sp. CA-152071 TaxID=3239933 RepID=UPI003D923382